MLRCYSHIKKNSKRLIKHLGFFVKDDLAYSILYIFFKTINICKYLTLTDTGVMYNMAKTSKKIGWG